MNKTEKERIIYDIRIREIAATDKECTSRENKLILIMVGIIFASFIGGINNTINLIGASVIIIYFSIIIIIIKFISIQNKKHTKDCYESLALSVKSNNLLEYRIPKYSTKLLRYKRKFKGQIFN